MDSSSKAFVWVGLTVGSFLGSLIPLAWGASELSFSSIILSGFGGIAGIYAGWKMSQ